MVTVAHNTRTIGEANDVGLAQSAVEEGLDRMRKAVSPNDEIADAAFADRLPSDRREHFGRGRQSLSKPAVRENRRTTSADRPLDERPLEIEEKIGNPDGIESAVEPVLTLPVQEFQVGRHGITRAAST